MEWRCEWCGKPHEENDPPCDNCGHGSFEEAVVRRTDLAAGDPEETVVWVCTECGRTHTKHTPPCSRCGHHELVRERQRVGEDELAAPGYLDLLTPRYVLGLVAVLALAALFLLGVAGVVSLPGFGSSIPAVEAPGEGERVDGLELSAVESEYVAELNERRAGAGQANLTREERLDEAAQFFNRRALLVEFTDRDPPDGDGARRAIRESCGDLEGVEPSRVTASLEGVEGERALAVALVERRLEEGSPAEYERSLTGVDVHAVEGTAYLLELSC